jgi:hypothetical protein
MNGVPRRGRCRKTALLGAPLLTLALLAGVTGCGDDGGSSDARRPGEQGDSRAGGGTSSGSPKGKGKASPSASAAESASPSVSAAPEGAADGTDTGACDDARCEVELSGGDELRPRSSYGIDRFTVQSVKGRVITWTAFFSSGSISMSASGAEETSTSCTNGSCSGRLGKSKGTIQMNGLTVKFTSIGEDSAVAKLSPKK